MNDKDRKIEDLGAAAAKYANLWHEARGEIQSLQAERDVYREALKKIKKRVSEDKEVGFFDQHLVTELCDFALSGGQDE